MTADVRMAAYLVLMVVANVAVVVAMVATVRDAWRAR